MMPNEPAATALALVTIGALMALSAMTSRFSGRLGVPLTLVFLGVGMLAGREGVGGLVFDDAHLAFQLGYIALVLILFDGGLNTPFKVMRSHIVPAVLLATFGVVVTAAVVAG